MVHSKTSKELIYDCLEERDRENVREILKSMDYENDHLDFKREWIETCKLAKHILAIANSGGGLIIFGVKEEEDGELVVDGLDDIKDQSDISVNSHLPEIAEEIYTVEAFNYDASEWSELEGKKIQTLFIEDNPKLIPLVCTKDGANIYEGDIYIRKNGKSQRADTYEDIDKLISRNVEARIEDTTVVRKDLEQILELREFKQDKLSSGFPLKKPFNPSNRLLWNYLEKVEAKKRYQLEKKLGVENIRYIEENEGMDEDK